MRVIATASEADTSKIVSGRLHPDTITTKSTSESCRATITTKFLNNGNMDVALGDGSEKITPRDLVRAMNRTLKLIRLLRQKAAKEILNG